MAVVSMKQLLEAGVHFGHQTRRWNPKMQTYIYTERNGIYIIDLQKTVKKLEEAYNFVKDVAANGQTVLFVGTKKQAQEAIREEASRVNMFYVNSRWLGGMLTNFKTMRTRVDRMNQLKKMQEDGTFDMLPKKEVMKLLGEMEKLEKYLGGVKEMKKLPGALFVVDPRKEHNAIAEARKLHIPILCTCDPSHTDDRYPYRICCLIHHSYCNRMDCRARHSSGFICQNKLSAVNVDLHSCQSVDQRNGIRPSSFYRFCHFRNISHIWAQLHDYRLFCIFFHFFCNILSRFRVLSECDSTFFHIRTGNIDLQHIHVFLCKTFYNFTIILR